MNPRDEKPFIIGFQVFKDGSSIKIFNNKTIKILNNSSEKTIVMDKAPNVKEGDKYWINTFFAEGERGLIVFAYSTWGKNAFVILDMNELTILEERSSDAKILQLFALPNGTFKENNNFIIYCNSGDNYIFSYQDCLLFNKNSKSLPKNMHAWYLERSGMLVAKNDSNQALLARGRFYGPNVVQLIDSDLKTSKAKLVLTSPDEKFSFIASKFLPISEHYTGCITIYKPKGWFTDNLHKLYIFSNDFTSNYNIMLSGVSQKGSIIDRNRYIYADEIRHVIFNGQYGAIVSQGDFEDTITILVFDINNPRKQFKVVFDNAPFFSSTPDGQLITCDRLGNTTIHHLLPKTEQVKIVEKMEEVLFGSNNSKQILPKDIVNVVTSYYDNGFFNKKSKIPQTFEEQKPDHYNKNRCTIS